MEIRYKKYISIMETLLENEVFSVIPAVTYRIEDLPATLKDCSKFNSWKYLLAFDELCDIKDTR